MRTNELPQDVVEELKEAEHTIDGIEAMSPAQTMDAWLTWNGIINFTDQILELARCVVAREQLDRAIEEAE